MNKNGYSSRRSFTVHSASDLNNFNRTRSTNNQHYYKKNGNKHQQQLSDQYLGNNNLNNNFAQTPNAHYPIFVNHAQALKILQIHYYYTNYCNNPAFESSFFYYFHPTCAGGTGIESGDEQPNNYLQNAPTISKYPTVCSAKRSYNPLILSYIQEEYHGGQMCNAIKQNSIQNQAISEQKNNRNISAFKPYSRSRANSVVVNMEDSAAKVVASNQYNVDQTSTKKDNKERINKSFPILKY